MEKTKYEIELITSDCLKILPTLKTNSFDFSFTDVPYNAGKDYGVYKDNLCESEWLSGLTKVFMELKRITNNKFAILIGAKQLRKVWNLLPESTLYIIYQRAFSFTPMYYGLLVTCKPKKVVPTVWDDVRLVSEGYFCKEEKFEHPGRTSDELTRKILDVFTIEGDRVLDSFSGVGTTAVCCKELGRGCLGIELNGEYNKIAKERLKKVVFVDDLMKF